ncbi:hypothetical protein ACIBI0_38410 [Microbispora rosea]|uniref:hypothetical protein n=1 Tax=Microbispora rosea TaxID=58117 RepID=UPI0037934103
MDTYRVVGSSRVAGVDPGGTVDLDPERVNIPALVAGGHVEPVKAPAKAKAQKAEPGSDVT